MRLFFGAQAWPFDFVAHGAVHQMAYAGTAGAVAAGTRPVDAAGFERLQQRLLWPGVHLRAIGLKPGDKKGHGARVTHGGIVFAQSATIPTNATHRR